MIGWALDGVVRTTLRLFAAYTRGRVGDRTANVIEQSMSEGLGNIGILANPASKAGAK